MKKDIFHSNQSVRISGNIENKEDDVDGKKFILKKVE
jgi:hypothetical protein